MSLYEVDDFDDAFQRVQHHCEIAALTRSEKGAVDRDAATRSTCRRGTRFREASSTPPARATSTPPASSTAHPRLRPRHVAGQLGALAAAEVISHLGARPERRWPSSPRRCSTADRSPMKLPRYRTGDADARRRRSPSSSNGSPTGDDADLIFELVASSLLLGTRRRPTVATSRSPTPRSRSCDTRSRCSRPYRVRPQGRDLRLGAHAARRSALRPDPRLAAAMADARLDGHHRRRARDHGGGHRGGGPRQCVRRQHPASVRVHDAASSSPTIRSSSGSGTSSPARSTFIKESHGFVLLPGGYGTMDEAFELLTLRADGQGAAGADRAARRPRRHATGTAGGTSSSEELGRPGTCRPRTSPRAASPTTSTPRSTRCSASTRTTTRSAS